jgi:hypothetical protein
LVSLSKPLIPVILAGLLCGLWAGSARADRLDSSADLDGLYLAIAPVGAAVHTETAWDATFGGELMLARITERQTIAVLGLVVGGHRYSERNTGRLWLDGLVGTRRVLDLALGLSVGPTAEVDRVIPPRFGAQATLWAYVGVMPYLRVGAVEKSGTFFEIGLRIPLPALRW